MKENVRGMKRGGRWSKGRWRQGIKDTEQERRLSEEGGTAVKDKEEKIGREKDKE